MMMVMSHGEGLDAREATAALRGGSATRLEEGFRRYLSVESVESARPSWDDREAMISLTPFIDCARRLGLDPATFLGPIAATAAPRLRELFEIFVRRSDIRLADFGWSIVETELGPAYRFD